MIGTEILGREGMIFVEILGCILVIIYMFDTHYMIYTYTLIPIMSYMYILHIHLILTMSYIFTFTKTFDTHELYISGYNTLKC